MAWDKDLTDEQKIATSYTGSPARLLAGPGTGKTRCLTQRIVYLIQERNIPANEILVLTFTRKAASELRNRTSMILGEGEILPHIATLHSYALSVLIKSKNENNLPKLLRVADDFEEKRIINKDLKRILGYTKSKMVSRKFNDLSSDWSKSGSDDAVRLTDPKFLSAWRQNRDIYSYALRSELVYQLNLCFEESRIIPEKFSHIMVDEYQDLNACDLSVIGYLSKQGAELYVAGDDDQSIYGFRNADPEGIRSFPKEFDGCKELVLTECKRSSHEILRLANHVADLDLKRIKKNSFSGISSPPNGVKILWFDDNKDEAEAIAQICQYLKNNEHLLPKDILILFRSNRNKCFSKPIIESVKKIGIPIADDPDIMDIFNCPADLPACKRSEGRIYLSYLKLFLSPTDNLAWRTLFELEGNNIGEVTLNSVYDYCQDKDVTFFDTIMKINAKEICVTKKDVAIGFAYGKICNKLEKLTDLATLPLEDFIIQSLNVIVQQEEIRNSIFSVLASVCNFSENKSLEALLRNLALRDEKIEQDSQEDQVRIMTMHQAKGLDALAVIVVAAEGEYLPGYDKGEMRDDARRLLYVSLTRAKYYLFVTHCIVRKGSQGWTGESQGSHTRHLTPFLSGGPIRSEDGASFIRTFFSQ
jgi:DNA helicase-2/ATP-dependent DNA helicase PcrA